MHKTTVHMEHSVYHRRRTLTTRADVQPDLLVTTVNKILTNACHQICVKMGAHVKTLRDHSPVLVPPGTMETFVTSIRTIV